MNTLIDLILQLLCAFVLDPLLALFRCARSKRRTPEPQRRLPLSNDVSPR